MSELKNCPFCGATEYPFEDKHEYWGLNGEHNTGCIIGCYDFSDYAVRDDLVKAWNTRADDAEIERLRRMVRRGLDAIATGRNEPLMIWRDWANRELYMPKAETI